MAFLNRIKLPDIPVYEAETDIAWDKVQIANTVNSEPTRGSLVRAVNFVPGGVLEYPASPKAIKHTLELAVELHQEAADFVGAQVVPHSYGVYHHDPAKYAGGAYGWLPKGYSFVAEVDIVDITDELDDNKTIELQEDLNKYFQTKLGQIAAVDVDERQFKPGTLRGSSACLNKNWFLDIEPRLTDKYI